MVHDSTSEHAEMQGAYLNKNENISFQAAYPGTVPRLIPFASSGHVKRHGKGLMSAGHNARPQIQRSKQRTRPNINCIKG
jgi:hypothetical protein